MMPPIPPPPPVPPTRPETDAPGDVADFDFTSRRELRPSADRAAGRTHERTGSTGVERLIVSVLGAEEAEEFLSLAERIHGRISAGVRRSPPFTVSLCLHVLVLIALALMFVRLDRARRTPIDLSFATPAAVEAEQPGVQIVQPAAEPVPEPQPEVMTEAKPVDDPAAAPVAAETDTVEVPGAAAGAPVAAAIGSLLEGREAGRREDLVGAYGGSDATEAAVALALEWLVRQQRKDGLWSLQGPYEDGASQENTLAATAMALLALQGAGNTPRAGLHNRAVATAWTALLKKQVPGGDDEPVEERRRSGAGRFVMGTQDPPDRQAMYSHGQVTIALCELYGMTKDPAFEIPARRAVAYALAAQGPNGGWRYEPGQDGDMSVTGWFMMALKSAQMAGLEVPPPAFESIGGFLDRMAVRQGSRYGYRFEAISLPDDVGEKKLVRHTAGPVTAAISAEGLLCRQYLGWPRNHPAFAAGVSTLLEEKFFDWQEDKDVYAWYYITQVVHHLGGPEWTRWNDRMKEVLPAVQVQKGRERGSWDPALDKWKPWGGRLFTTCFCTYMLEVYYRHLPLFGEGAVAQ